MTTLPLKPPQSMRMNLPPDVLKATIGHIFVRRVDTRNFTTVPREGGVDVCTSNIKTACRFVENQMWYYRTMAEDPCSPEGQMLKCALEAINNSVEKLSPIHATSRCEINFMDEP